MHNPDVTPSRSSSTAPVTMPAPTMRSPGKVAGPRAQRTVQSILNSARALFLDKGYVSTSVEDITTAAGVSRATFWTYFQSKPDVLRALGGDAESDGMALAISFGKVSRSENEISSWVHAYLEFLDKNGAFINATYQATYDDPELRAWATESMMAGSRAFGASLAALRGKKSSIKRDPAIEGLALLSMFESLWFHWRIGGTDLDYDAVVATISSLILAAIQP